jgi:short-subunit dehydrogenase
MEIADHHIVVTGAAGGIGAATVARLAQEGARLSLVGRDRAKLEALRQRLPRKSPGKNGAALVLSDLSAADGPQAAIAAATAENGPVDILVNNAGINHFGRFAAMTAAEIDNLLATNVAAPMKLAHAVLPGMIERRRGKIVNIGSVFGGVGFGGFAAYSAGKFALRGFSEALRRELHGSGVGVVYVAPRYTRTALNVGAIERMAKALAMRMDDPAAVADRIVKTIKDDTAECTIGMPERFFVRLNALFPRLVDSGMTKTTARMLSFITDSTHSS